MGSSKTDLASSVVSVSTDDRHCFDSDLRDICAILLVRGKRLGGCMNFQAFRPSSTTGRHMNRNDSVEFTYDTVGLQLQTN